MGLPTKPAKQKKRVAIENSLRLHTRGTPVAAAEAVKQLFYKNFFVLQNSRSCPQVYCGADQHQNLLQDGATDFLATI